MESQTTPRRAEVLRASPRMFESDLLDKLSRVHPAVPVVIFVPAILVMAVVGVIRYACRRHDWLYRVFGPGSTSVARPHLWTGPLFLGLVLISMSNLSADIIWTFSWVVYSWSNAIRITELTRRHAAKVVNDDSPHL